MEEEIWRLIARHDGYEVSSLGRVRSLDRVITRMCKRGPVRARLKGRVLRLTVAGSGYLVAMLGRARPYVHHLVLSTFVGARPAGHQAAHGDGDRRNNSLGNLRWATRSENEADKVRHGTRLAGARTPNGCETSCPRGHQYSELNTKRNRGRRHCRTCLREQRRRYRQARRVEGPRKAQRSGTYLVKSQVAAYFAGYPQRAARP